MIIAKNYQIDRCILPQIPFYEQLPFISEVTKWFMLLWISLLFCNLCSFSSTVAAQWSYDVNVISDFGYGFFISGLLRPELTLDYGERYYFTVYSNCTFPFYISDNPTGGNISESVVGDGSVINNGACNGSTLIFSPFLLSNGDTHEIYYACANENYTDFGNLININYPSSTTGFGMPSNDTTSSYSTGSITSTMTSSSNSRMTDSVSSTTIFSSTGMITGGAVTMTFTSSAIVNGSFTTNKAPEDASRNAVGNTILWTVVGSVVGVTIIVVGIIVFCLVCGKRKRRKRERDLELQSEHQRRIEDLSSRIKRSRSSLGSMKSNEMVSKGKEQSSTSKSKSGNEIISSRNNTIPHIEETAQHHSSSFSSSSSSLSRSPKSNSRAIDDILPREDFGEDTEIADLSEITNPLESPDHSFLELISEPEEEIKERGNSSEDAELTIMELSGSSPQIKRDEASPFWKRRLPLQRQHASDADKKLKVMKNAMKFQEMRLKTLIPAVTTQVKNYEHRTSDASSPSQLLSSNCPSLTNQSESMLPPTREDDEDTVIVHNSGHSSNRQ